MEPDLRLLWRTARRLASAKRRGAERRASDHARAEREVTAHTGARGANGQNRSTADADSDSPRAGASVGAGAAGGRVTAALPGRERGVRPRRALYRARPPTRDCRRAGRPDRRTSWWARRSGRADRPGYQEHRAFATMPALGASWPPRAGAWLRRRRPELLEVDEFEERGAFSDEVGHPDGPSAPRRSTRPGDLFCSLRSGERSGRWRRRCW